MTGSNICTTQFEPEELEGNDFTSILLHTLIFHVTGLCNLKCWHCWQSAKPEDQPERDDHKAGIVSPNDLMKVLRDAKTLGLACIKFTGGEPFLHPQIMDYLKVADQEGVAVGIETNGTLIEADRVAELKKIKRLFVAVSLDGATSDIHDRFRGVNGAYRRTMAAIEQLTRADISVQIIMSLYRENADSLCDVVKLANSCGVRSIKINPVQPMGRGRDLVRKKGALSVAELLQIAEYCRQELRPEFQGELNFSLPLAFRPFDEIRRQQFVVCRIFQILGLMPNGDLSFCGIGNIARSMVIGNIYQDDLSQLWQQAPLLVELRDALPQELKGVCGQCILSASCLGECRAIAYEQSGDLMSAFWICQQAYKEGLFPESRLYTASV